VAWIAGHLAFGCNDRADAVLTRRFAGGHALVQDRLVEVDVIVRGGTIDALVPPTKKFADLLDVVDCRDLIISPGFIDLQCNGAVGADITGEPGRIAEVAAALPRFGVTAFLPTVITSPPAARRAAIDAFVDGGRPSAGATPLGLHFEGPVISLDRLGAHPRRDVVDAHELGDEVDEWIESGAVALVTVAPEVDGAIDLIERLVAGGITVSVGHTAATPDDIADAKRAGARYATHLFNAMTPFNHRAPGPIGAVLADADLVAGLICDGIHVDPVAVAMAWRTLGPTRTSLVSDAVAALGMPYGRLNVAGFEVVHDETGVRTVDGVLAGSALALDQAVRNLMAFAGCTLADALRTVTTTPADLLGLTDRGRLRVGARADLTVLDADANLVATIVAGTLVHGRL
jgi:N-acetylglucosamine-6-phosphate deacetylase